MSNQEEVQVVDGPEWISGCGGGGIKRRCQVGVGLVCIVCLSRFSLSVCRSGFHTTYFANLSLVEYNNFYVVKTDSASKINSYVGILVSLLQKT
jgi:hypothetical protein